MSNDSSDIVQITDNPALDYFPSWTPDGRILFESDRGGDNDIYVIDPDGRNIVNLTNHPARDTEASWSPDGRYVAFSSDRSGQLEVWLMDSDGSNLRQLTEGGGHQPDWSSDSTKIVFVAKRKSEYENIFVIDLEGTYITRLTTTPAHDFNPCWISP
jgi:TolB protein